MGKKITCALIAALSAFSLCACEQTHDTTVREDAKFYNSKVDQIPGMMAPSTQQRYDEIKKDYGSEVAYQVAVMGLDLNEVISNDKNNCDW